MVDLRGRPAHRGRQRGATAAPMLVLLLGSNIGNFDPPAAARFLDRIRARSRSGRPAAARRRLVKPERRSAARLRRSARRDGGVQQEPAGAHQPRARRRLRPRGVRPPRASGTARQRRIEMHLVSRARKCVRVAARRRCRRVRRATRRSGRRAPTSTKPTRSSRWERTRPSRRASSGSRTEAQFALTLIDGGVGAGSYGRIRSPGRRAVPALVEPFGFELQGTTGSPTPNRSKCSTRSEPSASVITRSKRSPSASWRTSHRR